MGGSHHSCQLTAHVVNHSRSNMPYHAQKGDIHRFDTMNCGISLLHYCQKPAMELLLSPPFNLSPVRGSCMLQPTLKMVLASMLLQMDFGVAHSKEPFLMSRYSTLCSVKQSLLYPGNLLSSRDHQVRGVSGMVQNSPDLMIKEAIHIQTTPMNRLINRDKGAEIPGCWVATINALAQKRL